MATTDAQARYHEPLVKRYIRGIYPGFSKEQLEAADTLAREGGLELSTLHELALAKRLNLVRQSGKGHDLYCPCRGKKYEAKYRRLTKSTSVRGYESWVATLSDKSLRSKDADYVWLTVYNQFKGCEDHFMIPRGEIRNSSFTFSYNKATGSYNRGDQYLVQGGFLA